MIISGTSGPISSFASKREKLGGVPFEAKKEGKKTVLRFFPKGANAKNPDGIVFMLALDEEDKKKKVKKSLSFEEAVVFVQENGITDFKQAKAIVNQTINEGEASGDN